MRKYIIWFSVALITAILAAINSLSDFDLPPAEQQRTLHINHRQDTLEGTLILPPEQVSPAIYCFNSW